MDVTSENGDDSLSPCAFGSGAAQSPNSIFDLGSSPNYAQQKDDLLLQDDGSFSNGYYAIAAAFCPKMSREQQLCVPHSTDITDGCAHYVNKRKRGHENVYDSSQTVNRGELAKSKYTKFSTEPCDTFEHGNNIQPVRITEKNCRSDEVGHKISHSPFQTQINNILNSSFSAVSKKTELQSYVRSPEGSVMDNFRPDGSQILSVENPPEGTTSASQNSRKANMVWRLKGDGKSPSVEVNSVQTSHFNGCALSNVEYQNGVTSVVQHFPVDDADEWLNDSFSGLNHVSSKY